MVAMSAIELDAGENGKEPHETVSRAADRSAASARILKGRKAAVWFFFDRARKTLQKLLQSPFADGLRRARNGALALLIGQDPSKPLERQAALEFLAPADALRETPPSPVRMGMGMGICLLFMALIIIAIFGTLDINGAAAGRVQPVGRSKIIQPLYTGTVVSIHVQNGTPVKKGQVLVELDPTEPKAEMESVRHRVDALRAEIARRQAAIAAAQRRHFDVVPQITFPFGTLSSLQVRETEVLGADYSKLITSLAYQRSKMAENVVQIRSIITTSESRHHMMDVLQSRVNIRSNLERDGWESKASVLDAQEGVEREQVNLAQEQGQLAQLKVATTTARQQLEGTIAEFISGYMADLSKAEKELDDLEQQLVKAQSKVRYTTLTSPVDGSVQQVAVTTIGQVVNAGQQLMIVVPQHAVLEVEALLDNKDIGFVKEGQSAVVKVDAYPFTRYGALSGHVTRISRDSVTTAVQQQGMGDTQQKPVQAEQAGAQQVPSMQGVFPVVVTLDSSTLLVEGKPMPIVPGMSVQVEIKTGKRHVWEYVLSPVLKVVSESSHER